MAPLPKNTIHHFTHPTHPLSEVHHNKEYLCDGCKTPGTGTRYRCDACDFDLHEHCATCPASFSSFMHPQHPLSLVLRKAQGVRQNNRICDVCGDQVEGLFYRCKVCDFDVHPLCTQLPQYVRHAMHPDHPLTLQRSSPSLCMVCQDVCASWRYKCGKVNCKVDIHLECVLSFSPSNTSRSCPPPSPPPPPPRHHYYGAYPHGYPPTPPPPYGGYYGFPPPPLATSGRESNKMMYELVGKLAFGVLTNMVFGISDFSSFM